MEKDKETNIEKEERFDPKKVKPMSKKDMDELTKSLYWKLREFIREKKLDVLLKRGNLNEYSIFNALWLMNQKEGVTTVKTLNQWNRLGRSVLPGEKSLKILAPIKELRWEDKLDEDGNPVLDEKTNKPVRVKKETIRGYKPVPVFDISQTKGKELDVYKFDETKPVEDKDAIIKGLQYVTGKKGYRWEFVNIEKLGKDTYGVCKPSERKIEIRNDLSSLQTVSTSCHESGHALAHTDYRKDFNGLKPIEKREVKEVEAEMIACQVCSYLGLDTTNFNFSYICGWSDGEIERFVENIMNCGKYSSELIKGIEREFRQMKIGIAKADKENSKDPNPIVQELELSPFSKGSQTPVMAPARKRELEIG